jgi:cobalt-zinc-cadmium efflux system protein
VGQARRLSIAVVLNVVIIAVQVVFGLRAHSLGLLADAGHNLTDVGALGLSLWAVHLMRRAPNTKQSFGYHRSGILAAQANAALILIASAFILVEGVRRMAHPHAVEGLVVIVVAGVAMLANGVAAWLLHDHSGDINMRSALLHMLGDAVASAGVIVAGIIMYATDGSFWLDPLVSILIGAVIGWRAVHLLMQTTDILMEATPASIDLGAVSAAVTQVDGVESIHDLHVWSLSTEVSAMSAHVVLEGHPSLEQAQVVGERVKTRLAHGFAIGHATLELECEPCATHDDDDCLANSGVVSSRRHVGH